MVSPRFCTIFTVISLCTNFHAHNNLILPVLGLNPFSPFSKLTKHCHLHAQSHIISWWRTSYTYDTWNKYSDSSRTIATSSAAAATIWTKSIYDSEPAKFRTTSSDFELCPTKSDTIKYKPAANAK